MKYIKIPLTILLIILTFNMNISAQIIDDGIHKSQFVDNEVYTVDSLLNSSFEDPENLGVDALLQYNKKENYIFNFIKPHIYFGYTHIYDNKVSLDKETVRYLYEDLNNINKSKDSYNFDYNNFNQELEGLIIGGEILKNIKNPKITILTSLKLLQGRNLRIQKFNGKIIKDKNQEDKITAETTSVNMKTGNSSEMFEVNPRSKGYGLSLNINYKIDKKKHLELLLDNFSSQIIWKDIYIQTGKINTDNIYKDEEGFLNYKSSFDGEFSYDKVITYLTPEYQLSYNSDFLSAGLYYRNKLFPFINYKVYEENSLGHKIQIKTGLFGDYYDFNIKYGSFETNLKSKALDITSSTGLYLSFNLEFFF